MPASIFGERFFGRRQPAWHRIGTVMDTDATVSEAMKYVDVLCENPLLMTLNIVY
mgnify:CR=1 FL=1